VLTPKHVRKPITQPEIDANKHVYDEHFDKEYAQSMAEDILGPIMDYYFRAKFIGFDKAPVRENGLPLIYASNHSGMSFPWDAIIFKAGVWRHFGKNMDHSVRTLSAPALSFFHLMNLYLVPNYWKKVGAVDASFLNFETMMQYEQGHVCIYPEGVPGIGKGFNKRYQLQRFSTSTIRVALKHGATIQPLSVVNGEFINPLSYNVGWVNMIAQMLGLPFFPIGLTTPLIIFFPWMFYFAFPSNLKYVKGKSVNLQDWLEKPAEAANDDDVIKLRDKLQAQMQFELNAAREQHGKWPYKIWDWMWTGLKNMNQFPYHIPLFWPAIFNYHDQFMKKNPGKKFVKPKGLLGLLKMIVKTPFTIFFFIPIFGWIPILLRGYRNKRLRLKIEMQ